VILIAVAIGVVAALGGIWIATASMALVVAVQVVNLVIIRRGRR
jgi:hypothetical protein